MRLDKFTIKAQEALQDAQSVAEKFGHQQITPDHLLHALLRQEGGVVGPILEKLGVLPDLLVRQLDERLEREPKVSGVQAGAQINQELMGVMNAALAEAERLKDEYVSTEHLLIAIAGDQQSEAGRILHSHGATKDAIYKASMSAGLNAIIQIQGVPR